MTRKPTPKPKAKPPRASRTKSAPPAAAKPAPVQQAATAQAGGYVFAIGPVKTKPGDRLKGAAK